MNTQPFEAPPTELFEEDYAAARKVIALLEKDSCSFQQLDELARQHADLGMRHFEIRHGLRPPRNELDRLLRDNEWPLKDENPNKRFLDVLYSRPLDESILDALYQEIQLRVSHRDEFSKCCRDTLMRSDRNGQVERRRAARFHVREMLRPIRVHGPWLPALLEFVEEVRHCRYVPPVSMYESGEPSVYSMALGALTSVAEAWNCFVKSAYEVPEEKQTDFALTRMGCSLVFAIPIGHDLAALLRQEQVAARLEMRDRVRRFTVQPTISGHVENTVRFSPVTQVDPQIVNPEFHVTAPATRGDESHPPRANCPSDHSNAEVDAGSSPRSAPDSDRPVRPGTKIHLKYWAIAYDEKMTWWLFRLKDKRWILRRRIDVPDGNPSLLLRELCDQGGHLSRDQAVAVLKPRYHGKSNRELGRVITDALAKVKTAMRQAVAQCRRLSVDHVPTPIRFSEPGWRIVCQVGHFEYDDAKQPTFRPTGSV